MERDPNHLVFLCYGQERVFHECTYALLSLFRLYGHGELPGLHICIYTDKPEWFRRFAGYRFPISFRQVDTQTIIRWRGNIDFVHRVKVEALLDFTKEHSGNILYADTDMVFTHPVDTILADIATGTFYMHIMEGVISTSDNIVFKKLNRYLQAGTPRTLNSKPMNEMAMWNAGVLGFHSSRRHLLDEVLAFTDREYPGFRKHIVEQFAFSVYFQQAGRLKAAAPYMFHYWKLKEAGVILASFFDYFNDRSPDELVQLSKLVQMHALMQEKVNYYHGRGLIAGIMGRHWQPDIPDWQTLEAHI